MTTKCNNVAHRYTPVTKGLAICRLKCAVAKCECYHEGCNEFFKHSVEIAERVSKGCQKSMIKICLAIVRRCVKNARNLFRR